MRAGRNGLLQAAALLIAPAAAAADLGLSLLWRVSAGAPPLTAPVVVKDDVLVGDSRGVITRIDGAGKPLEVARLDEPIAQIWKGSGRVLALTRKGRVVALDRRGGELDLSAEPAADAALFDGQAYLPLLDGTLAAVDLAELKPVWRKTLPGVCRLTPAVAADRLLAATDTDRAVLLERAGGESVATVHLGASAASAPGFAHGLFLAGAPGERLFAISAETGKVEWKAEIGRGPAAPITDGGDSILVASLANQLIALRENGTPRWRAPLPARTKLAPVVDRDRVLCVPFRSGLLVGFNLATGEPRSGFRLPESFEWLASAPVRSGNLLLVLTSRGDLLALAEPQPVPAPAALPTVNAPAMPLPSSPPGPAPATPAKPPAPASPPPRSVPEGDGATDDRDR